MLNLGSGPPLASRKWRWFLHGRSLYWFGADSQRVELTGVVQSCKVIREPKSATSIGHDRQK